jgi:hypothetical protein
MIFYLMFTLRCWLADFFSLPVLLTLAINYHQCCCYQPSIIVGIVVTGDCVAVTGDKVIAGVTESMKIRNKA